MAARDQPNVLPPGVDDMLDMPPGHDRERMKEVEGIKAEANGKFKEEEADGDLEEVYKDISDDEYCGEDDEMEREINLMKEEGGNTDMSELEELVQPSL